MIDLKETIKQEDIDKNIKLVTDKDPETQVSGLIFTSTDYDVFNFLTGNRSIDPNNVKKLKESISENGYKKSQPIIVNQDFEIIDGQHRFTACEELKLPIYFTIEREDEDSIKLTQNLNKNQKNWGLIDYIKSYADRGYQDYINLLNFIEDRNLNLTTTIVLAWGTRNAIIRNKIMQGKIHFTSFEENRIDEIINRLKEIKEKIPNNLDIEKKLRNAILTENFAAVMVKIMREDNYDHNRMLKQIASNYRSIDLRNRNTMGDSLVAIYNKKLKNRADKLPYYADME